MGMFSQKYESEYAKNLPWHGNGARLFSCDLDVEKASVVKTLKKTVKETNGKKATILGPLYDFTGDDRVLKSPPSLAQFSCTASEYKLTALYMRLS